MYQDFAGMRNVQALQVHIVLPCHPERSEIIEDYRKEAKDPLSHGHSCITGKKTDSSAPLRSAQNDTSAGSQAV